MESVGVAKLSVDNLHECFEYHPWDNEQTKIGVEVRAALEEAARIILVNVPDCPDRSVALRITHRGKF